ncbi:MAG TPA: class I SAM-dependent methyltransferase [Sandaracinaceae bacterium LLY-WYZ-13_1]|nr:class I SAM-dependent methyltransferase [Sandaracinaceae bacterium LLY-WYZ-13_1]
MTYGVIVGERGDPARWRDERRVLRRGPGTPYRKLQTLRHLVTRDRAAVRRFLTASYRVSRAERLRMLRAFVTITNAVRGYHTLSEILVAVDRILSRAGPGLTVVEAGAGSGASTAKLSLAVRAAGGRLHVFDTFRGIPANDERHRLLDGTPIRFVKGAFRGRLGAVRRRVAAHGAPEVCTFHKGLFEDTLRRFDGAVDVALLDVDLVASTRTCLKTLWPRLRPGGVLLSQDGHLRATHELLADDAFFRDDLGTAPPRVRAVCGDKLLELCPQYFEED